MLQEGSSYVSRLSSLNVLLGQVIGDHVDCLLAVAKLGVGRMLTPSDMGRRAARASVLDRISGTRSGWIAV